MLSIICKKTENIKEKCNKKYGNAKLHVLEFKLTALKNNQCATSVKHKYQEKRYNQKLINRKFLIIQNQFIEISNAKAVF